MVSSISTCIMISNFDAGSAGRGRGVRISRGVVGVVLFIICMTCATSTAQPTFSVHIGANVPISLRDPFFLDGYWAVGLSAGVAGGIGLTNWLRLVPSITYDLFRLREDYWKYIAMSGNGTSGQPSVSGDGIHHLRFDMGFRFTEPSDTSRIKPFFQIGGGYVLERIGRISLNRESNDGFHIEPRDRHYWIYMIGAGAVARISGNICLEPSLVCLSNTDDRVYALFRFKVFYVFVL
jgi:hypothetical protein